MMGPAPEAIDVSAPMELTLPLGQLGDERRDNRIYDDKMVTQPEYSFGGVKDGAACGSNTGR